jgi:hypothetical protein
MIQPPTERELLKTLAGLLGPAQAMTEIATPGGAATVKAVRAAEEGSRSTLAHPPTDAAALLAYDLLETLADCMAVAVSAFEHYGGAPLDQAQEHARGALLGALHAAERHVRAKQGLRTK